MRFKIIIIATDAQILKFPNHFIQSKVNVELDLIVFDFYSNIIKNFSVNSSKLICESVAKKIIYEKSLKYFDLKSVKFNYKPLLYL